MKKLKLLSKIFKLKNGKGGLVKVIKEDPIKGTIDWVAVNGIAIPFEEPRDFFLNRFTEVTNG